MPYATEADLEIALGGPAVLVQLADPGQTGTADAATVTDYLEGAAGIVRAAVEVKHEPETIAALDAASVRHLRDLEKWWAASLAWLEGSRGQAMPDRIREQREWVQTELDRIRTGERRLGRVSGGRVATLSAPPSGKVDFDARRTGMSVQALKDNGFR